MEEELNNKSSENEYQPSKEEKMEMELEQLCARLGATDWYFIRFVDTGVSVPDDIKTERASIRTRISELRSISLE